MRPLIIVAVVLIVLAVPLIFGKVPPNSFYGFRTPKTMSSPEIWYPANRVSAIYPALAGGVMLLAALVLHRIGWSQEQSQAIMLILITAPIGIAVLLSFLHLRKL